MRSIRTRLRRTSRPGRRGRCRPVRGSEKHCFETSRWTSPYCTRWRTDARTGQAPPPGLHSARVPLRRIATSLATLTCAAPCPARGAFADIRYSPAQQCWAIQDVAAAKFLVKQGSTLRPRPRRRPARRSRSTSRPPALGRYLLFGKAGGLPGRRRQRHALAAGAPAATPDWLVERHERRTLHARAPRVAAAHRGRGGRRGEHRPRPGRRWRSRAHDGLRDLPGGRGQRHRHALPRPAHVRPQTKGLIETHLHGMAFEFFGGSLHCGRPWHPLRDHRRAGRLPRSRPATARAALVENFLAYGDPSQGPRHRRLADLQGLAAPQAPTSTSRPTTRARARLARRAAALHEPARRQRGAVQGLPAQAQHAATRWRPCACRSTRHATQMQRLHRRAERRPGQGLAADRQEPVRGPQGDQRRQARARPGHRDVRAVRLRRVQPRADLHARADRRAARGVPRARRAPDGARQQVRQRAHRRDRRRRHVRRHHQQRQQGRDRVTTGRWRPA